MRIFVFRFFRKRKNTLTLVRWLKMRKNFLKVGVPTFKICL
ncbi:hypothetical protein LEP1GSC051_0669 [Leptospira sp. P2653]|nr:hypothetical protein LEP1GSC051_0669 [Leptospira sp. P2653]